MEQNIKIKKELYHRVFKNNVTIFDINDYEKRAGLVALGISDYCNEIKSADYKKFTFLKDPCTATNLEYVNLELENASSCEPIEKNMIILCSTHTLSIDIPLKSYQKGDFKKLIGGNILEGLILRSSNGIGVVPIYNMKDYNLLEKLCK